MQVCIEAESIGIIAEALKINTSLERLEYQEENGEEFLQIFPENQTIRELALVTSK